VLRAPAVYSDVLEAFHRGGADATDPLGARSRAGLQPGDADP
jgi:hypothetical protein